MIINTSYFFGDLYVPQVTEVSVANTLNKYIQKYEPEFLQRVFGYAMAKDVSASPSLYPDIISGKEFNDVYIANQLNKWKGLKIALGNSKYASIIANYVYIKYMTDNMSYSTGSGEKVIDQATSMTVSPAAKITRAWNDMADQVIILQRFMLSDRTTYSAYNFNNTDTLLTRRTNPLGI